MSLAIKTCFLFIIRFKLIAFHFGGNQSKFTHGKTLMAQARLIYCFIPKTCVYLKMSKATVCRELEYFDIEIHQHHTRPNTVKTIED